jgi:D-beta-D-heptose 7-phosphate kinase / D-beta-D-heptose 1-phosphate adenosyltransferase
MTTLHTELLRSMGRPRILVAGDVILDRYLWGTVDRISPEGPIPILQIEREEQRPGGAANVARNLIALGADAACAGAVGDDVAGRFLIDVLEADGVDVSAVVIDPSRPTPIKTRCIGGSQQMLRIDRESAIAIARHAERELADHIDDQVAKVDLVILSDYTKGSLTEVVLAAAMSAASKHAKPVIVGPKGADFSKYRGCSAVVPNLKELALATAMPLSSDVDVVAAAGALLRSIGCDFIVVTRGGDGMTLVRREGAPLHIRTRSRHVYDVAGAGDTALATLGLALASHASPDDAVHLANAAGALAVTKVGVAAVTRAELLDDLGEEHGLRPAKIGTERELLPRLAEHRDRHETVVFTNGCFDVLHIGHLRTLGHAKAQGDVLVVAINSDASARRLKGPHRPIVTQQERAEVLAALEDVDYVVIFDEDTPSQLLKRLRPDVLVKGGDYQLDEVVGADIMTAWAGRVSVAPVVPGVSTTELVERIMRPRS